MGLSCARATLSGLCRATRSPELVLKLHAVVVLDGLNSFAVRQRLWTAHGLHFLDCRRAMHSGLSTIYTVWTLDGLHCLDSRRATLSGL
eukprot:3021902-Rhodomonas_salina.1